MVRTRLGFFVVGAIALIALAGCQGSPNIALPAPPAPRAFVTNSHKAPNVIFFCCGCAPALCDVEGPCCQLGGGLSTRRHVLHKTRRELAAIHRQRRLAGHHRRSFQGRRHRLAAVRARQILGTMRRPLTLAANLLNVYGTPLSPGGAPNFGLGTPSGLLGHPGGIAFDSLGNLYVNDFTPDFCHDFCESVAGTINVFAPGVSSGATKSFSWHVPDANNVLAIAFDAQGHLWASDTENNANNCCEGCFFDGTLFKFDPNKKASGDPRPFSGYIPCGTSAEAKWDCGSFSSPAGIAFDRAGNMYVANESCNNVLVFSAAKVRNCNGLHQCGNSIQPDAVLCAEEFSGNAPGPCKDTIASDPSSVAIDVAQRLFVGYRDNGLIGVYNPPFGTNCSCFCSSICDANVKPAFQIPAPHVSGNILLTAGFMVFDSAGNLYVPYAGDSAGTTGGIAIFIPPYSSSSAPIFVLTSGLTNPYGIAFGK